MRIYKSLVLWASIGLLSIAGCASKITKPELAANTDPNQEIANIQDGINKGYEAQYDVLDAESFAKAQTYLNKAKERVQDGDKQEKILDSLATSEGYLRRAKEIAEGRQAQAQAILNARQLALNAGSREFPREKAMLKETDDDLRAQVGKSQIKPTDFADLQKRYLDLELSAIQTSKLGASRAIIDGARLNGALKNCPKTLTQAELAMHNAENQIASNRDNPISYQQSVDEANSTAKLLDTVLSTTKRPGGEVISEATALALVRQDRAIKNLNGELDQAQSQISDRNQTLTEQQEQLQKANTKVKLDQAYEHARKQFNSNEAEVYREGSKLVIRLKSMAFATNRAELPPAALDILAKVRDVASDLNPSQVLVEGHTDSTGDAKINLALSQERAQAVAKYLANNGIAPERVEAIGYGFQKPLASNKSKAGRAQNRRVDIVITPIGAATEQKADLHNNSEQM